MPRMTPERNAGPLLEEKIIFEENQTADEVGSVAYNGTNFEMHDATGIFDPRTGGSGITEAQHKVLRNGIHFIPDGPAEGFASLAYKETTRTGAFIDSEIWYDDNTKAKKIFEAIYTRAGSFRSQEQWKIYDIDGSTVLATITDAITRSGPFESSRVRTIT